MEFGKEPAGRIWEVYLDEQNYQELRRKSAALIKRQSTAMSARGDDLLQETLLRLLQSGDRLTFNSPDHFRATVSLRMSRVLIDMLRASKAARRGHGFQHTPFEESTARQSESVLQDPAIRRALDSLGLCEARLHRVMELRIEGNSFDEIANELSISVRTVKRDWKKANQWMRKKLNLIPLTSQEKGFERWRPRKMAALNPLVGILF